MSSTGFEKPGSRQPSDMEKTTTTSPMDFKDRTPDQDAETAIPYTSSDDSLKPAIDTTRRKLKPRHIQLIGIGGWVFLLDFSDIPGKRD